MNFWANSLQLVAGATGVISRVQLPATGRIAIAPFSSGNSRTLPAPAALRDHPHPGAAQHRSRHRAQFRAVCMSKANF